MGFQHPTEQQVAVKNHAARITKLMLQQSQNAPWYTWLESDKGKAASDQDSRQSLENRLWQAFIAGQHSNRGT